MAVELSSNDDSSQPISAINVTPFVDVVLVLLVIFMLTAPIMVKEILGIKLPNANHSDQKSAQAFGVAVTVQGQILLNGQIIDEPGLTEMIRVELVKQPNLQVIISADKDSKHGDLVRVIDIVKGAGAVRFALQIQKPKT